MAVLLSLSKCHTYLLILQFTDSIISDIQRDHMEAIEKLVPDLASLRARLCPSYMDIDVFWKIYFTLLESNLTEHTSEVSLVIYAFLEVYATSYIVLCTCGVTYFLLYAFRVSDII